MPRKNEMTVRELLAKLQNLVDEGLGNEVVGFSYGFQNISIVNKVSSLEKSWLEYDEFLRMYKLDDGEDDIHDFGDDPHQDDPLQFCIVLS